MRLVGLAVILTLSLFAAPLAAEAQQARRGPLIAILEPGTAARPSGGVRNFREALRALGWIEGQNVAVEVRFGDWKPDRIANGAAELVRLRPDVLYTHSDIGVHAARRATATIPIVVGMASDLVGIGGVASLARPGGNVTGVTAAQPELDRKRVELLKEAVPSASRVGFIFNSEAMTEPWMRQVTEAATMLNVRLQRIGVTEPHELESAFVAMVQQGVQGLLVQDASLLARDVKRVTALALKHRLPSISQMPGFATNGGLLQYGADVLAMFRRSATHVDKILRGARPGDLPVEQPTNIELIVNLKTAKTLGLAIPPSLLLRAAQVIE